METSLINTNILWPKCERITVAIFWPSTEAKNLLTNCHAVYESKFN